MADAADAVTVPRFRAAGLVVETKPDRSPVTEADRAAEQAMRALLARERPGDGVLGEEFGADPAGERRWILDPIDGTINYLRGIPVWGTLIALEQAGEVVAGVVSAPLLGRRWWAARGDRRLRQRGAAAGLPGGPPGRCPTVLQRPGHLRGMRLRAPGPGAEPPLLAHPRLRRLLVVHDGGRGSGGPGGGPHRRGLGPGPAAGDRRRGRGPLQRLRRAAGGSTAATRWRATAWCTTRPWRSSTTPTRRCRRVQGTVVA